MVAFCDIDQERSENRRDEFYPDAIVTTDHREILSRKDIEVVNIATRPGVRVSLIETALKAEKHVLSQKPFVLDLADGERLAGVADENKVRLAVNHNGRWAPHFSDIREAVRTLNAAYRGIGAADRSTQAANEQLRAEKIRLEYGESTPFEVLLKETDLVQAESKWISAIQVYRNAVTTLERQQGTILETNNIHLDQVAPLR